MKLLTKFKLVNLTYLSLAIFSAFSQQIFAASSCQITSGVSLYRSYTTLSGSIEAELIIKNESEGTSTIYSYDEIIESRGGGRWKTPQSNLYVYSSPPAIYYELAMFKQLPEFRDGKFNKEVLKNDTFFVSVWGQENNVNFYYLVWDDQTEEVQEKLNAALEANNTDQFMRIAVRRGNLQSLGQGSCKSVSR